MRRISCAVYTEYSFASSTSWTVALDVSCQTRQQLVGIHNSSTLTLENRVENVQHDIYIVAQNQAINGKRYRVQKNWVRTFHLGRIIPTLFSMCNSKIFHWLFIEKNEMLSSERLWMLQICAYYFVEEGGNAWVSHLTPLSDSLLYADDYKYTLRMKNIICPPKIDFPKMNKMTNSFLKILFCKRDFKFKDRSFPIMIENTNTNDKWQIIFCKRSRPDLFQ